MADWKAVDAAMIQAAAMAEKVAAFRHPKLSAVRLAGELNKKPIEGATLDELLERIKEQLTKLGPINRPGDRGGAGGVEPGGRLGTAGELDRGEPNDRARPAF